MRKHCQFTDGNGYTYLTCNYDSDTGICIKCGRKLGTRRIVKIKCRRCDKDKTERAYCKKYKTECRQCIKEIIKYYQLCLRGL